VDTYIISKQIAGVDLHRLIYYLKLILYPVFQIRLKGLPVVGVSFHKRQQYLTTILKR